jgi:hypothetical protein
MPVYTKIPKPTGVPYTNVNTQGREQFDQANITYDAVNVFYDGIDTNAYTVVNKPTVQGFTKVPKPTT